MSLPGQRAIAGWPVARRHRAASTVVTIWAIGFGMLLLDGCRQATPSEVGEQSIRDAQPMAVMQASERASQVSPGVVPEAAKGGAVQQAPSRLAR